MFNKQNSASLNFMLTAGAESDLAQATRLARRMVTRWAMGSLGLATFQADEQQPFLSYELAQGRDYSDATAARIDQDVEGLLDECHRAACDLLAGARELLDRFVETLLHEETIGQEELEHILGPSPKPAEATL
jgi:cell division protease FtsH